MSNQTTIAVPGTFFAVTTDLSSYAGATVYVHGINQQWWKGERIGTLGGMVGHGAFATFGTPEAYGSVLRENVTNWWVEHIGREEAAVRMATQHLSNERVGHVGAGA